MVKNLTRILVRILVILALAALVGGAIVALVLL